MLIIDEDNNITLTRSDSCAVSLSVIDSEGESYDYSSDLVQLTIKGSTNTQHVVIQKTITNDFFKITPEDTKDLDYGIYKYDVQLITQNNDVYTIIGPCDFILAEEVNYNVTR